MIWTTSLVLPLSLKRSSGRAAADRHQTHQDFAQSVGSRKLSSQALLCRVIVAVSANYADVDMRLIGRGDRGHLQAALRESRHRLVTPCVRAYLSHAVFAWSV